jgi:hypothetical protein
MAPVCHNVAVRGRPPHQSFLDYLYFFSQNLSSMVPIEDAPRGYGPNKTLYNRFIRWSRLGVFDLCLP